MVTVGVREMKAHLSRYIRLVQEQQADVAVTARGKAVARLVPAAGGLPTAHDLLVSLAAQGLVELPKVPRRRTVGKPVMPKAGGRSLSEMIVEDRQ